MASVTIGYGALLTALGVGGYFGTGAKSKTALIPAAFGAAALGLGLLAKKERYRTGALGGAALLSGLGIAGSAKGLTKLPDLLAEPHVRPGEAARRVALVVDLLDPPLELLQVHDQPLREMVTREMSRETPSSPAKARRSLRSAFRKSNELRGECFNTRAKKAFSPSSRPWAFTRRTGALL